MDCGIMQPYLFPYLGYFQLIQAVDTFVIYDDVQFIKGGWINRNRILEKGKEHLFTFGLKNDSTFLKINERFFSEKFEREVDKFMKLLLVNYSKSPYFTEVYDLIESILSFNEKNLSKFITNAILVLCDYMGISSKIITSSNILDKEKQHFDGEERVIFVNKLLRATRYINAIGGVSLYSREAFTAEGITLTFIKMNPIIYKQFNDDFIPNLSIIDVLLFNNKSEITKLLNQYTLI